MAARAVAVLAAVEPQAVAAVEPQAVAAVFSWARHVPVRAPTPGQVAGSLPASQGKLPTHCRPISLLRRRVATPRARRGTQPSRK